MTTEQKPEVKCPDCGEMFKSHAGLGSHRRTHGVKGSGKTTLALRVKNNREKFTPKKNKKNSERSTELATVQATATPIHHTNGHKAHRNHPATETAITFALGRFEALCGEISSKFNLPPLDFAHALVTAIAGQYSQVR